MHGLGALSGVASGTDARGWHGDFALISEVGRTGF
jgi:hypothetical protein